MDSEKRLLTAIEKRYSGHQNKNARIGARIIAYSFQYDENHSVFDGTMTFVGGREREATFITYEESEGAKVVEFFNNTSRIRHVGVLCPWFYVFDEKKKIFIVGYDHFDCLLADWNHGPPSSQLRDVFSTVAYLHEENYLHMGLDNKKNYVIQDNTVKIINVMGGKDELNRSDSEKLKDLKELGNLLNELHPGPSNDLQDLLAYLLHPEQNITVVRFTAKHVLNKVYTHPYFKSAKRRLKYFYIVRQAIVNGALEEPAVITSALKSKFPGLKSWTRRFKAQIQNTTPPDPILQDVYDYGITFGNVKYTDSIQSLMIFLRDLYIHGLKNGHFLHVDQVISRDFPGLLCAVHGLFYPQEKNEMEY